MLLFVVPWWLVDDGVDSARAERAVNKEGKSVTTIVMLVTIEVTRG